MLAEIKPAGPAVAWQVAYNQSRAATLTKDFAAARSAIARAQALVPETPVAFRAAVQTAILTVALEAATGRRDAMVASLALFPVDSQLAADGAKQLSNRAPQCGEDGITKDDWVDVTMGQSGASRIVSPISLGASRTLVVRPFMVAIGGAWRSNWIPEDRGPPLIRLRCREALPVEYVEGDAGIASSLWAAQRNLRPRFFGAEFYRDEDALTSASRALDALVAKVGSNSLIAALPKIEVADLVMSRTAQSGDVSPARAAQQYDGVRAIKTRIGALFAPLLVGPNLPAAEGRAATIAALTRVPTPFAAQGASEILKVSGIQSTDVISIVDTILDGHRSALDARTVRFFTLKKATALHDLGRFAEVEPLLKASKIPTDRCRLQARLPGLESAGFRDGDFPKDAEMVDLSGTTLFEFDLDAAGNITSARAVAEVPPLAFDQATAKALVNTKYAPARDVRGRPISCKAVVQSVRWNLPKRDANPPVADFSPRY